MTFADLAKQHPECPSVKVTIELQRLFIKCHEHLISKTLYRMLNAEHDASASWDSAFVGEERPILPKD